MNVRWLWFNHFPQELELTAAERAKAKRLAKSHAWREPRFHGANRAMMQVMIPTIVLAGALQVALIVFAARSVTPWVTFFYMAIFWPGMAWANHRARRPFIHKALNDLGHPVCIACGYLLNGVESSRCPECGELRAEPCERVLSAEELADSMTVHLMNRLGNAVCRACGAMWVEGHEKLPKCPKCRGGRRHIEDALPAGRFLR